MRFRVTAVQDAGLPQSWNDAQPWLEEWLNNSLGAGAAFGLDEVCIMLVIFASDALPRAPAPSRLITSGVDAPTLALHLVVPVAKVLATPPADHVPLLCTEVLHGLPVKPARCPAGLHYPQLREALLAAVRPFADKD